MNCVIVHGPPFLQQLVLAYHVIVQGKRGVLAGCSKSPPVLLEG